MRNNEMQRRQGTYWLGTISEEQDWNPSLVEGLLYVKGQEEEGDGGFKHHQVFFVTEKKQSTRGVAKLFAPIIGHWELTRSEAAEDYVWKEATRVGEQYEFGIKPLKRNSRKDWDEIRNMAKEGRLDDIPADVFVRYYGTLKSIRADYRKPVATERSCTVFWGATGTGKSRRAWEEAGDDAYAKDPRTKFWCGYKGNLKLNEVNQTLSSMNFEEVSMSRTCCDGLIDTRSLLKLKDPLIPFKPKEFGLPQISTRVPGTQI